MKLKLPTSMALELVPRHLESLLAESQLTLGRFPQLQSINVPEINSVPIKSLEASLFLRAQLAGLLPESGQL